MEKVDWKELNIKPHNIVLAWTSTPDYEMSRLILLQTDDYDYIVLEGGHCSCYDFDDTEWEAIKWERGDLKNLAETKLKEKYDYWGEKDFWKKVVDFL